MVRTLFCAVVLLWGHRMSFAYLMVSYKDCLSARQPCILLPVILNSWRLFHGGAYMTWHAISLPHSFSKTRVCSKIWGLKLTIKFQHGTYGNSFTPWREGDCRKQCKCRLRVRLHTGRRPFSEHQVSETWITPVGFVAYVTRPSELKVRI
jgi:hypothetical protein